jgi:large repetitive protein
MNNSTQNPCALFAVIMLKPAKIARWLITTLVMVAAMQSHAQITNVINPTGGFHIDGNLISNTPTANVGDWLSGPGGTGGFVLSNSGVPADPIKTKHIVDVYNNSADITFTGSKGNADPNDHTKFKWTATNVSNKTDINNANLHISKVSSTDHTWAMFSADRLATNGTTYVDFEFLQNTLVRTADGFFVSNGPHGGRTINDFVLTVEYTNGGSVANIVYYSWKQTSPGVYDYVQITPAPSTGFAFTSSANTSVPYGAFGNLTYINNAFVEGAVDLDAFIGAAINDVCAGLNIKTVFIKSKASASISANLEDLVEPIQLNFGIGFFATASATPILCNGGNSTITVTANGGVGPFTYSIDNGAFQSSNTFVVTAGGPYMLKVKDSNNCISVSTTISITQPSALGLSVSSTNESCNGDSNGTATATANGGTPGYTYTITGDSYGPVSNGTGIFTNLPAGNYTITLTDANGCQKNAPVSITTFEIPQCSIAGLDIVCPGSQGNTYTASAGMDAYEWVLISGSAQIIGASNLAFVIVDAPLTCGSYTLDLTITKNGCSSKCTYTVDVIDETNPEIMGVGPNQTIECSEAIIFSNPTFTDNCTLEPSSSYEDVFEAGDCAGNYVLTRTWFVIDACGNSAQLSQTFTIQDTTAPVSDIESTEITIECGESYESMAINWTDNCDQDLEYTAISAIGFDGCNKIVSEVYYATDDCGNVGSVERIIHIVDTTAPTANLQSEEITVECGDDIPAFVPVWSDACDSELQTSAISGISPEGCGNVIFQTYFAQDDCGNEGSINRTIHIVDTTVPVLHNVPADTDGDCSQIPGVPTSVFATDVCDNNVVPVFEENIEIIDACTYKIIRTWTANDDCNNSVSQSQIITVTDELAPIIYSGPGTQYIECNEDLPVNDPIFYDLCDQDLTIEFSTYDEIIDCVKIIHNSWTATDDCNNSTVMSALIYVFDNTPPTLTGVPDNTIAECDNIPAPADVTVQDNCDLDLEVIYNESNPVYLNCGYYFIRTWTVSDDCGNETTGSQMITVIDTQAPTADIENAEITIECGESYESMEINWTDNCDENLEYSAISAIAIDGCNKIVSEVYYATDDCGNVGSVERIIHIVDTTAPTANLESEEITVECGDETPPFDIIWTDACDAELEFSAISGIGIEGCGEVVFQTFFATDDCGNASSVNRTIHYVDTTNPVLHNVPADVSVECGQIPGVPTSVFATDICDNSVVPVFDESIESGDACTYYIIRTWTATDDCENSTSLSQTITVTDNTPPVIHNAPESTTASCEAIPGVSDAVFATDNCSETLLQFTSEETSDCPYTITRTWTATDECGNEATATQIITVIDNVPPVLHNVPQDFEGQCGDIPTEGSVTVTDNCDDNAYIVYDETPLSDICPVQILREWTAYDNCGNSSYASQLITINDTEAPVFIGVPDNTTAECDNIPAPADITVEDNCASDLEVIYSESSPIYLNCGYYVIRDWYVVDYCGNEAYASQMITVTDTTAPTADVENAEITIECGESYESMVINWTDNCDEDLEYTAISAIGFEGCNKIVSEVYYATDDCGNIGSVERIIHIVDTTAPTANLESEEITVECGNETPAFNIVWSDVCDTELEISAISGIGIEGCGEVVFQTFFATDDCGNTSSVNRTIHYVDTTNPFLNNVPADVSAECGQLPAIADVTVTDNCDQNIEVIYSETGEQDGCYYNIVRTWTATDACGNETSASQTIIVGDNTAPYVVESSPSELWIECNQDIPALEVLFADNCDEELTYLPSEEVINSADCQYDIQRTITATDDCGNATTFTQIIHVSDYTAPVVLWAPANLNIDCNGEVPLLETPQFSDNCDDELDIEYVLAIADLMCGYAYIHTWVATDNCGNSVEVVQEVTVSDTEAPVVNSYEISVHLECDLVDSYIGITATDNCGEVHITYTDMLNSGGCLGTLIRTYEVKDDCGNITIVQQFISIQDTHGPIIMNPADQIVECNEAPTSIPDIAIYDACGMEVEILDASQEIVVIDECTYQIIWHWEAIDYCENLSEATTVITVTDTTNPTFSDVAEDMSFSCEDEFETPSAPTASDNCDDNVEVISGQEIIPGSCPQNYDIIYTWRASDNCGNATVVATVYHISDYTAPEFGTNNQMNFFYQCNEAVELVQPIAADNCGTVSYTHEDNNFWSEGCSNGFTRIWTATDQCGNSSEFIQFIVVQDTIAPEVDGEFEITILCDEYAGVYITATDNCNEVSIDYTDEAVSGSCAGKYIRTYEVSDGCGNTTVFTQIISLIDETLPVSVNPIADLILECGDDYESYTPEFTDNCDQELEIVSSTDISVSEDGCTTTIYESWSATDDCGNTLVVSRTITIVDTTAPTFDALPQDMSYNCGDMIAVDNVTASDVCDLEVEVSYSDAIEEGNCPANYVIVRTWTAEDNCGNTATHVQYITIADNEAPDFVYVPQGEIYSCDEDFIIDEPTTFDLCSDVTLSFEDVYEYYCNNSYSQIRNWTAIDACGNVSTASATFYIYDNVAPEFDQDLSDISVECSDAIPAPVNVTATDNCGNALVTVEVITVDEDNCGNPTLYVSYTATDDCENVSITGYYIHIEDTTEPTLSGCPNDIVLSCTEALPTPAIVTAEDNCDEDVFVDYEEFFIGNEPAEGSIADCNLLTPVRPANNPCSYPYDWAMVMFGLPNAHKYYTVQNGNLVQYPNGTAHVTATMHNVLNPANGWNVDVWFSGAMNWSQWSNQAFQTNFKADCGGEAINHIDWTYLILQAGAGAELTGFGGYAGSTLNLNHAPSNHYFGFQLGNGANNYNGADNGFGGWFSYSGMFLVNNAPYGNNQGNVSGAGDFAFELDCCPQYSVVRQWTAIDCSGNTSTCVQNISFASTGVVNSPVVPAVSLIASDKEIALNVSPNPATDKAVFTFIPIQNANTTIEVFDMAGARITGFDLGAVDAGVEYKVNYDVSKLSTGIYSYRVINGMSIKTGKLVVGK